MYDVDRMWYWSRYLGNSVRVRVCFLEWENRQEYVKQIMVEVRPDVQQVIEVPVNTDRRSGLNIGNLLIVGGLGYVLFKTFLLEERVNDLTVLLKRQALHQPDRVRSRDPIVTNSGPTHDQEDEYETSDDDDDDNHPPPRSRTHTDADEEEDEVRIEEQPREVPPPAEIPTRDVAVVTPSASAFVTTRQRRSGSELRRDSSRTGASTRES